VLDDLVAVPDEVQGVYWYDCDSMGWKFWAPGAPGCTLANLGGGVVATHMITRLQSLMIVIGVSHCHKASDLNNFTIHSIKKGSCQITEAAPFFFRPHQ